MSLLFSLKETKCYQGSGMQLSSQNPLLLSTHEVLGSVLNTHNWHGKHSLVISAPGGEGRRRGGSQSPPCSRPAWVSSKKRKRNGKEKTKTNKRGCRESSSVGEHPQSPEGAKTLGGGTEQPGKEERGRDSTMNCSVKLRGKALGPAVRMTWLDAQMGAVQKTSSQLV